jgi:hypothetical protein
MKTKYTLHSLPAIVGGTIAAGGAIALLTRDAYATGLTLDHALMPVLVGLTILTGHLAVQALKEWKLLSCSGFLALAVLGSGITVYETMGRRAETRDAKVAQAAKSVDQYAAIAADYRRATELVTQAETWVASECRSGAGAKCRGNQFVLSQRSAHASSLKAQLEQATAPAPVDPKADRAAAVAGLLGYSADMTKKAVQTFEPFVLPLFLELGAIILFGFGVGHRSVPVSRVSVGVPAETPKALSFERPLTDDEVEQIRRLLEGRSAPVTNDELAALAGVTKSEMSKRTSKAQEMGVIHKFKAGRFNQIGRATSELQSR